MVQCQRVRQSRRRQYGNAPRTIDDALIQFRKNVDLVSPRTRVRRAVSRGDPVRDSST
jgi:hypothetical protein